MEQNQYNSSVSVNGGVLLIVVNPRAGEQGARDDQVPFCSC